MSRYVDFKAVKAAVSMLQVLEHYGPAAGFKRTGNSLSGPCPLHGGENRTQFRVSLEKNCWNCFGTARVAETFWISSRARRGVPSAKRRSRCATGLSCRRRRSWRGPRGTPENRPRRRHRESGASTEGIECESVRFR